MDAKTIFDRTGFTNQINFFFDDLLQNPEFKYNV